MTSHIKKYPFNLSPTHSYSFVSAEWNSLKVYQLLNSVLLPSVLSFFPTFSMITPFHLSFYFSPDLFSPSAHCLFPTSFSFLLTFTPLLRLLFFAPHLHNCLLFSSKIHFSPACFHSVASSSL